MRREASGKGILSKEKGAFLKDPGGRLKICLVYPNTYGVGMSNLGFQTLYGLLNSEKTCLCERVFLPEAKEIQRLSEGGKKLSSLESKRPLDAFDAIVFSISFEEDYLNVVTILDLAGIPILPKDRAGWPLILAGGCAITLNPEPLSVMMDAFFIGEAEGRTHGIVETLSKELDREDVLRELASLGGFYVPDFYSFAFDGPVISSVKAEKGFPLPIKRARLKDIDGASLPETIVFTPDTEFSNTHLIEVERGCGRGCRFCVAGFVYLPPRFRSVTRIKESLEKSPAKKVGFVGAAVSEHKELKELLRFAAEKGMKATLSSLRADMIDSELLRLLKDSGYSTVTFAPEAGSERLRRVINKDITDQRIIETAKLIKEQGIKKIKLYFMLGLPTETDEDAFGIARLAIEVKKALGGGRVSISVTPFVPKPVTPFQWRALEREETIERRYSIVKDELRKEGGIEINAFSLKETLLQAYLSRGDKRAGEFVIFGAREGWKKALKKFSAEIEESVYRVRAEGEILPSDVIDHGIEKAYLWKEYQKGLQGKITPPCDVGRCVRCGVC
ncbi:MAG: radical SAM protein [Thermodesulfobacteriota bacterium]